MTQFTGLDVKIQLPNNHNKRIKTPLSFESLLEQVTHLRPAKGVSADELTLSYEDPEGEAVVIQDDADLEIAYSLAMGGAKRRIKFIVDGLTIEPRKPKNKADREEKKREGMNPRKILSNMIKKETEDGAT